ELVPNINGPGYYFFGPDFGTTAIDKTPFLILNPGDPPKKLTDELLRRYDKDKNGKLSRKEIGLDQATFDQLDANKDGELDAAELVQWTARRADIELIARIGKPPPRRPRINSFATLIGAVGSELFKDGVIEAYRPDGKPALLASALKKGDDGSPLLQLTD